MLTSSSGSSCPNLASTPTHPSSTNTPTSPLLHLHTNSSAPPPTRCTTSSTSTIHPIPSYYCHTLDIETNGMAPKA